MSNSNACQSENVINEMFFYYPGLGDGKPGRGEDVHLLTVGGVCVSGKWSDDGRFIGWCNKPIRDLDKEHKLRNIYANTMTIKRNV
jgi:hypothetical protein